MIERKANLGLFMYAIYVLYLVLNRIIVLKEMEFNTMLVHRFSI